MAVNLLPEKQGLKPNVIVRSGLTVLTAVNLLPEKQGLKLKKRSEDRDSITLAVNLLPEKQGLKHGLLYRPYTVYVWPLIYFQKNKD